MHRQHRGTPVTRECRYKERCYRKNPVHFQEYSHLHLTEIINNTNPGEDFVVPPYLRACQDIVLDQLQILVDHNIVPRTISTNDVTASTNKITIRTPENINGTYTAQTSRAAQAATANSAVTANTADTIVIDDTDDTPVTATPANTANTVVTTPVTTVSAAATTLTADESKNSRRSRSPEVDRTGVRTKIPEDCFSVMVPAGNFAAKLAAAAPYNFFLTTVAADPATHNEPLSVTFTELLDSSLGELESSVQINFMVEIRWLLAHYIVSGNRDKPLLIVYGAEDPDLAKIGRKLPNVTPVHVKMASPFGTHHTKMSLLGYKDGSMRVVVSTANLYEDDWENRTQGVWVSPRLPSMGQSVWDTRAGDSATGFRDDLLRYLITYKLTELQPWITRIRRTDFSAVNVFLVPSIPGSHRTALDKSRYGHTRLGDLLSKHLIPPPPSTPTPSLENGDPVATAAICGVRASDTVIAQSSSIGSLGPGLNSWAGGEFLVSASRYNTSAPTAADMTSRLCLPVAAASTVNPLLRGLPPFKMIYPSLANVTASHDGLSGGGCLPYNVKTHSKQPWLMDVLHQWRAKSRSRSRAMPHIKTYCRAAGPLRNCAGLHWFLLTSANLSKAAWGVFNKSSTSGGGRGALTGEPALRIMNYEMGVLFLPKFVLGDEAAVLPLLRRLDVEGGCQTGGDDPATRAYFPMPYDLPLTPYNPDDSPFFMDLLRGE